MIKNKEIKQLQKKVSGLPPRKHNNLETDYKTFIDHLENNQSNNNKIDYNQKLSSEQIIDLMNRLQFHEISKNVFSDKDVNITIKPQTSLYQVIRLYGHSRYRKDRDNDLNQADIEPENIEQTFLSRLFKLFS